MLKRVLFWVRIVAVIAAIALPAYISHVKHAAKPTTQVQQPPTLACASTAECEVRGKDEWERCRHVKDPLTPEQQSAVAGDATSKTQEGYACLCIASVCRWADKEAQACQNTGGQYRPRDICPPCPPNAACEACFVGCQCAPGKSFDKTAGCQ
jgi:hypothetical protein